MNTTKKAALLMSSLSIYRGLTQHPVIKAFHELISSVDGSVWDFTEAWGHFFSLLCENGCVSDWARYLTQAVLYDDNAISRAAAAGKTADLPEPMLRAVRRDLSVLRRLSLLRPETILSDYCHQDELGFVVRELPRWQNGQPIGEFCHEDKTLEELSAFYRHNGCGMFARYRAFIWRSGRIEPVSYPDSITLSSLKSYEVQRQAVVDNTLAFLKGVNSNNCLLYGDRGTGKSSTVKALLNAYACEGLRMVEMPKDRLGDFPLLVERLAEIPLKFIIFIDDLSFSSDDKSYAQLKAVLEGGLAVRPYNTLIYATSNRRHIVKESFAERSGDDIHVNDTIQETLSLSDRFGLAVNFSKPNKEQYLAIVEGLAAEKHLCVDRDKMVHDAEQFAISRGGRSPRCAIQFIAALETELTLSSAAVTE